MVWQIELTATAVKQLARPDKTEARRITAFMRQRLAVLGDPRTTGKALSGPQLGMYWRYRIGDYRVICDIQNNRLCVLVIEIGHRREVYR